MAIGYCISHNIKLPKFKKLKEKFSKKLDLDLENENENEPLDPEKENATKKTMTEEESRDAKVIVSEIENAEKDMLIGNLKSDRMTDEELREEARKYVKAGKLKPEILQADRKTINDALVDLIIAEFKAPEQAKENTHAMK